MSVDDDFNKIFEQMRRMLSGDMNDIHNRGHFPTGDEKEMTSKDRKKKNKETPKKDEELKHGNGLSKEEEKKLYDEIFEVPENKNPFDSKSYSISYKFGTGMDKPEIRVNGDIPKGGIMDLIKKFGMNPKGSHNILKQFQPPQPERMDKTKHQKDSGKKKDPIVDIYEEGNEIHVVMEMPGKKKNEIEILASKNEIEVNGKEISLPHEIDIESATSRLKNGILQIKLKKTNKKPKRKLNIE